MRIGGTVLMTALVAGLMSPAAARAEISDGVVKIGVLTDMSGAYADVGGQRAVEAVRMAVADFGGKVNGKPIEVVFADHQNKADIASSIARQWFDQDKVDMVVDLLNSGVALAVHQIAKDKNKVDIVTGAATSDLTGKACTPNGVHYVYDTYALAKGTGGALVGQGGTSWFFITADYAFGQALERDTTRFIEAAGGKVLGSVKAPLATQDFSSFLLQAQSSGAKVVGLANAGADTTTSVKQAHEFGITQGGQKLAAMLPFLTDIHAMGLEIAQGLVLTTGFYWDRDEETRAFAQRFFEKTKAMPTMVQAGDYSGTMQYLKAVQAIDSDVGDKVVAQMKKTPVDDFFSKGGRVREDGRLVHDMYLAEVKKPGESTKPWDYYKILKVIPGDEAFRPMADGGCPLVKG